MVTYINKNTHGKYAGNSSEEKPLEVQNGSVFFEIDTGLYYMYDAENKVWYEQKENGGGGGSYTLPVATESTLGGIKAPAKTPDQTVPVGIGEDNKLYVAPSGGEQVQSDWAENDPQSPAYVKNRFGGYEETSEVEAFPSTELAFNPQGDKFQAIVPGNHDLGLVIGQTATVMWDGVTYERTVADNRFGKAIGNESYSPIPGVDNGDPFVVLNRGTQLFVFTKQEGNHTVAIKKTSSSLAKIPEKFIPNTASIVIDRTISTWTDEMWEQARTAFKARKEVWFRIIGDKYGKILGMYDGKNAIYAMYTGIETINDGVVNPYPQYTPIKTPENGVKLFEEATATGDYSFAEGWRTSASYLYSHAEGFGTTASGIASHAEGDAVTASGNYSHAEGGYTTASGNYSHAEGGYTTASGNYSHAEGKYNIPDTNDGTPEGTPNNKYAHIVGNGSSNAPSNAHTLDWDGNSWYQGSVLVGGKDMDAPMAVLAPGHIIIKASDSEDRFKITVDKTGVIKAEKVI